MPVVISGVSPTISTSPYSANDVVGGLLTFPIGGGKSFGGITTTGFLRVLTVTDDDNEKAAAKLHIFASAPTAIADGDAFAPSFADLKKRIGVVAVAAADYVSFSSNGVAQAIIKGIEMEFTAGDGNLYAFFVCDATPTYTAAADLAFTVITYID